MMKAQDIVIDELTALKERIARNIVSSGQNASGRTASSLNVVDEGDSVQLLGRSHFGTMQTGRKAGKVPRGFMAIIMQWMSDKGIKGDPMPYLRTPSQRWQPKYTPQQRGDMSLAGAIVHKIKTEGTKLHRDGGNSDIYSNEIPLTIKSIRTKLAGIYQTQITNIKL